MAEKTHWKKLYNPDYIGAYALMNGDTPIELNVTILSVAKKMIEGEAGKKEECTVATLKGQKPWILNATNQKSITKALGSPFIEDWAGKTVTLYVAKVRAFGETVDALRVKPEAPSIKLPALTPTHERWAGAKTALAAGNITVEAIKKNFTLTPENEKLLCDNSK